MTRARLFDAGTIAELDWPATPDGDYARRYLLPFVRHGPSTYIANVHRTALYVLRVDDAILPVTATDFHPANSYVCSPFTHYVSYARDELVNLDNRPLEALLRALFVPFGWYLRRAQLDRVVYVNNWLLSTNLYPTLRPEQITAALSHLIDAFPDRAVVFRSVDAAHNPVVHRTLRDAGCRMVFSRSVYYQDVATPHVQRRHNYRLDAKHLERTAYEIVDGADLPPADADRLVELYDALYLDKYSRYNPQFTPTFLRLAMAEGLLTIRALRRDGRIDGVLGYFERRGILTPPLFGYDTRLPRSLGLYRLLSALTAREAQRRGDIVHFSAGVGPFKRARGGIPSVEYNAVYDAHLGPARRRPWALLETMMDRAIVPVIRRRGF